MPIYKIEPGMFIPTNEVLLWRGDSKRWEVSRITPQYVGNPEYAYTYWTSLPGNPE